MAATAAADRSVTVEQDPETGEATVTVADGTAVENATVAVRSDATYAGNGTCDADESGAESDEEERDSGDIDGSETEDDKEERDDGGATSSGCSGGAPGNAGNVPGRSYRRVGRSGVRVTRSRTRSPTRLVFGVSPESFTGDTRPGCDPLRVDVEPAARSRGACRDQRGVSAVSAG